MSKGRTSWLRKFIGEMGSKLRETLPSGLLFRNLRWSSKYTLDSSRVDYTKTKGLYHNTLDDYKLGAGFARPIIDTTVGFIGIPTINSDDDNAQTYLAEYFERWTGKLVRILRNAVRDGDIFVRLARVDEIDKQLYKSDAPRIELFLIPPGRVTPILDPETGTVSKYIIKTDIEYTDEEGRTRKYTHIETITREEITVRYEGPDIPPGVQGSTKPNTWGFIPIVHFKNEPEEDEIYGRSDLEPVEPFLKAYHDVMLHALQGSKMHSTPKLKLKVSDIKSFLENNFPEEDLEAGEISIEGREFLIFKDEEDAEFLEVQSAIGSTTDLLKFLFFCIVDVSQTPEFAFGTAVQSSKASVSEQMVPLIRKIIRKREQFEDDFKMLARMLLAMLEQAGVATFGSYETYLIWDEINPRDEKQVAETLKTTVEALQIALESGLMGLESAVDYLSEIVPTMMKYISDDPEVPGERDKIIRTKILMRRLDDTEILTQELEELEREAERRRKEALGLGEGDGE